MSHGSPHRRVLALLLLTAGVSLAVAAPAGAQAEATATPNQPGAGTRLHWAVDGTVPPVSSRIPSALTVTAPAGFTFDEQAIAERCKPLDARLDECPAKSRIGSALMTIRVFKPNGINDLPIDIKLYMGKGQDIMAVAFLAGTRVVPGRIDTSDGIQVVFDPLPVPPEIPGVSYEFRGVTVDLGMTARVVQRAKGAKHGKKRKRKVVRVPLVHAPATCPAGGWPMAATLTFPDGTSAEMEAPAACAGS